jgi:methyl-accepting chemotaxis protein
MNTNQEKIKTLRSQFLTRSLITLLVIVLISGVIQLYFINEQISKNVENQGLLVAQSIEQGIQETNMASKSIEHQIDLKLIACAKYISDQLQDRDLGEISNEELIKIRDSLNLAGITLLAQNGDDVIGVKATDPKEEGFSFKQFGPDATRPMFDLLKGDVPRVSGGAYTEKNIMVLPISQSGSHTDKPEFFKYAYYHRPGTNYIIDPYIQANEVYQFTEQVGPNAWISKVMKSNPLVKEIAVVNPHVFQDPSLEKKLYPPMKKIEYGQFQFESEKDKETLTKLADKPDKTYYVEKVNGNKVYKMFIPINKDQTIYIALDYGAMSSTLYHYSIILIVFGLVSLLGLFIVTTGFFHRIYENIQRIKKHIKLLEEGDFTSRSHVKDNSELTKLSESINRMTETLQQVLKDTSEQAINAQRMSVLLEAEANQSVEKMFTLSMETTLNAREQLEELMNFLDSLERYLQSRPETEKEKDLLEQIHVIREITKDRTVATTDMTLSLSDLLKSLHEQASDLSDLSNNLLEHIKKFKL